MLQRASTLAPRITALAPSTTTFSRGQGTGTSRVFGAQYETMPDFRRKEEKEYIAPPSLGAIERYGGWMPFIGLGAAALVSKEVMLLNPNHLFLTHFGFVMTLGYLWGTDAIEGAKREEYWGKRRQVDAHLEMTIEALKIHKNILTAASKTHSQLVVALAKDDESWEVEKSYREYQQKVDLRNEMLAEIEKLEVKDANLRKQLDLEAAQALNSAVGTVVAGLTDADREAYTNLAIDLLGRPTAATWCLPFHERVQAELKK